jgi:hypothetical protein
MTANEVLALAAKLDSDLAAWRARGRTEVLEDRRTLRSNQPKEEK